MILVVPGAAFVRGDAFALNGYIGFRETPSARYANTWIRIPTRDRAYARIAAAVTLRSELELAQLVNANSIRERRIDGRQLVGVVGEDGFGSLNNATFYFLASGVPLPVMKLSKSWGGAVFTTSFSRWNERVRFTLPRISVNVGRTGLEG